MVDTSSLWDTFSFSFKWWLFLLLGVVIPLDFLYRHGALLTSLSPLQLAHNFSTIIVIFTILALCLAGVSAVFALFWAPQGSQRSDIAVKTNFIVGIYFIIIVFLDYFWRWIRVTFVIFNLIPDSKIRIIVSFLLFIMFTTILIVFRRKIFAVYDDLNSVVKSFYKFIYPVFLLCSLILLIVISHSLYTNFRGDNAALRHHDEKRAYPNILIITFDSLAARYSSLYTHYLNTTPNLDNLGRESFVFDNMYATCNNTRPSLASLMSGKYPYNHRINHSMSYFWGSSQKQNLPSILKELNYETAAVWSSNQSCPWDFNLEGFDRILPESPAKQFLFASGLGPTPWLINLIWDSRFYNIFETLFDLWQYRPNQIETSLRADFSLTKASELITKFKKPFFLWVHLYPPHAPYLADRDFLYTRLPEKILDNKENYSSRLIVYKPDQQPVIDKFLKRYEEYITETDHKFGQFLTFLKEKQVLNNTILIVSADHGEIFARGYWGHGGPYLYEPLIRVPLMIHLPEQTQGKRLDINASTVDLAPTILDLLGVEPSPPWMDGQSLRPAWQKNNFDRGVIFSMNLGYLNVPNPSLLTKSIAAIRGNYELVHYIDFKRYEKYDLKHDKILEKLSPKEEEIFSLLQRDLERAYP